MNRINISLNAYKLLEWQSVFVNNYNIYPDTSVGAVLQLYFHVGGNRLLRL